MSRNKFINKINSREVIQIFAIAIGILGLVFTIIKSFPDNLILILSVILILALLIALSLSYFRNTYLENKLEKKVLQNKIFNHSEKIKKLTRKMSNDSDLYKLKLIEGRYNVEADKFLAICRGRWKLYALNSDEYCLYIHRQILDDLNEGDVYRTLATIDFWEKDKTDENLAIEYKDISMKHRKSFLNSNFDAIKRNVKIERYFLVDNQEVLKNPNGVYCLRLKSIIYRLNKSIESTSSLYIGKSPNESLLHNMENSTFMFYLSDNYLTEIENQQAGFSLISNKNSKSAMIIKINIKDRSKEMENKNEEEIQRLKEQIEFKSIEILFPKNTKQSSYIELEKRFDQYANAHINKLKTIDQMCQILNIKNG